MKHSTRASGRYFPTPETFPSEHGISNSRVRTWAREGRLPAVRLGNLAMVARDALERLLDRKDWGEGLRQDQACGGRGGEV